MRIYDCCSNGSLSCRNLGKSGLRVSCLGLGECPRPPARLLARGCTAGLPCSMGEKKWTVRKHASAAGTAFLALPAANCGQKILLCPQYAPARCSGGGSALTEPAAGLRSGWERAQDEPGGLPARVSRSQSTDRSIYGSAIVAGDNGFVWLKRSRSLTQIRGGFFQAGSSAAMWPRSSHVVLSFSPPDIRESKRGVLRVLCHMRWCQTWPRHTGAVPGQLGWAVRARRGQGQDRAPHGTAPAHCPHPQPPCSTCPFSPPQGHG